MDNKILLILGMHRSGTSLISHWLYKCGLNIGENLLGVGVGNVEGHFEDLDFLRIHEDILKSKNLSRIGMTNSKIISCLNEEDEKKLQTLINQKNSRHLQWGWKDPRTCLFLDFYRQSLPNAKSLIIIRDVNTVVSSLLRRAYKKYEKKHLSKLNSFYTFIFKMFKQYYLHLFYMRRVRFYIEVWINYNEELLKHIESIDENDFILVNYKMLLNESEQVYTHLKNNWLFNLDYYDFRNIYNENLMSPIIHFEKYIFNKKVLRRAQKVQAQLLSKSFDKKIAASPLSND